MNTDAILDFVVENYIWFIVGGAVLLLAILGLIVDKKKLLPKNKKSKEIIEAEKNDELVIDERLELNNQNDSVLPQTLEIGEENDIPATYPVIENLEINDSETFPVETMNLDSDSILKVQDNMDSLNVQDEVQKFNGGYDEVDSIDSTLDNNVSNEKNIFVNEQIDAFMDNNKNDNEKTTDATNLEFSESLNNDVPNLFDEVYEKEKNNVQVTELNNLKESATEIVDFPENDSQNEISGLDYVNTSNNLNIVDEFKNEDENDEVLTNNYIEPTDLNVDENTFSEVEDLESDKVEDDTSNSIEQFEDVMVDDIKSSDNTKFNDTIISNDSSAFDDADKKSFDSLKLSGVDADIDRINNMTFSDNDAKLEDTMQISYSQLKEIVQDIISENEAENIKNDKKNANEISLENAKPDSARKNTEDDVWKF